MAQIKTESQKAIDRALKAINKSGRSLLPNQKLRGTKLVIPGNPVYNSDLSTNKFGNQSVENINLNNKDFIEKVYNTEATKNIIPQNTQEIIKDESPTVLQRGLGLLGSIPSLSSFVGQTLNSRNDLIKQGVPELLANYASPYIGVGREVGKGITGVLGNLLPDSIGGKALRDVSNNLSNKGSFLIDPIKEYLDLKGDKTTLNTLNDFVKSTELKLPSKIPIIGNTINGAKVLEGLVGFGLDLISPADEAGTAAKIYNSIQNPIGVIGKKALQEVGIVKKGIETSIGPTNGLINRINDLTKEILGKPQIANEILSKTGYNSIEDFAYNTIKESTINKDLAENILLRNVNTELGGSQNLVGATQTLQDTFNSTIGNTLNDTVQIAENFSKKNDLINVTENFKKIEDGITNNYKKIASKVDKTADDYIALIKGQPELLKTKILNSSPDFIQTQVSKLDNATNSAIKLLREERDIREANNIIQSLAYPIASLGEKVSDFTKGIFSGKHSRLENLIATSSADIPDLKFGSRLNERILQSFDNTSIVNNVRNKFTQEVGTNNLKELDELLNNKDLYKEADQFIKTVEKQLPENSPVLLRNTVKITNPFIDIPIITENLKGFNIPESFPLLKRYEKLNKLINDSRLNSYSNNGLLKPIEIIDGYLRHTITDKSPSGLGFQFLKREQEKTILENLLNPENPTKFLSDPRIINAYANEELIQTLSRLELSNNIKRFLINGDSILSGNSNVGNFIKTQLNKDVGILSTEELKNAIKGAVEYVGEKKLEEVLGFVGVKFRLDKEGKVLLTGSKKNLNPVNLLNYLSNSLNDESFKNIITSGNFQKDSEIFSLLRESLFKYAEKQSNLSKVLLERLDSKLQDVIALAIANNTKLNSDSGYKVLDIIEQQGLTKFLQSFLVDTPTQIRTYMDAGLISPTVASSINKFVKSSNLSEDLVLGFKNIATETKYSDVIDKIPALNILQKFTNFTKMSLISSPAQLFRNATGDFVNIFTSLGINMWKDKDVLKLVRKNAQKQILGNSSISAEIGTGGEILKSLFAKTVSNKNEELVTDVQKVANYLVNNGGSSVKWDVVSKLDGVNIQNSVLGSLKQGGKELLTFFPQILEIEELYARTAVAVAMARKYPYDLSKALQEFNNFYKVLGDLPMIEQMFAKRFFTYYTWGRRNFANITNALFDNPRTRAIWVAYYSALNKLQDEDLKNETTGLSSDSFFKNNFWIGGKDFYMSELIDTPVSGGIKFANMLSSLNNMLKASNPIIYSGVSLATNKDINSGKPINVFEDRNIKINELGLLKPTSTTINLLRNAPKLIADIFGFREINDANNPNKKDYRIDPYMNFAIQKMPISFLNDIGRLIVSYQDNKGESQIKDILRFSLGLKIYGQKNLDTEIFNSKLQKNENIKRALVSENLVEASNTINASPLQKLNLGLPLTEETYNKAIKQKQSGLNYYDFKDRLETEKNKEVKALKLKKIKIPKFTPVKLKNLQPKI